MIRLTSVFCFLVISFFGLSQSTDLTDVKESLAKEDLNRFWEQASKLVDEWNVDRDNRSASPFFKEAKERSQVLGNLGTKKTREEGHEQSAQRKADQEKNEKKEKKMSVLAAMNKMVLYKKDASLMMTLMEEYVRE